MHWLRRILARRRIRPVVAVMPAALATAYGGAAVYSPGQVEATVKRLRLCARLKPFAIAAFCRDADFRAALTDAPAGEQKRLREEIAALFDLEPTFTATTLRKSRIRRPWNPVWSASDQDAIDMRHSGRGHDGD